MNFSRLQQVAILVAGLGALGGSVWAGGTESKPDTDLPVTRLTDVRRVFVDTLIGGGTAGNMREMIIASLQRSNLFLITEDESRADAILRGAAEDLIYTDVHSLDDSISLRVNSASRRGATSSRTSDSDSAGASLSQRESSRIQERKHEATATVRLVLKNGDVVWSTIQESNGAKFRGASADVAEKITRQLKLDLDRARLVKPAVASVVPASAPR